MKLKEGVIITKVGTDHIVVAAGQAGQSFSGMIKMNGSAAFIAEQFKQDTTVENVAAALMEKYDVTEQLAVDSINSVINRLSDVGLME